jgi:hypothetical protein
MVMKGNMFLLHWNCLIVFNLYLSFSLFDYKEWQFGFLRKLRI